MNFSDAHEFRCLVFVYKAQNLVSKRMDEFIIEYAASAMT